MDVAWLSLDKGSEARGRGDCVSRGGVPGLAQCRGICKDRNLFFHLTLEATLGAFGESSFTAAAHRYIVENGGERSTKE